ncbi:VOC family protein [Arthrobacter dokdonensis]|uniref:VOC family protein n=1 Tax=Arthrobacter dokdonellae TaxID=2211210 RepID=UPI000DE5A0FA|nr:VOC family protein [Arthrobacter dokdonellae]
MSAHELDHLAIAVPAWAPAGSLLNRELGARWASGFRMEAFNPCQLAVAEDMRLELLEPGSGERSFIRRFLSEGNGAAAPHHITFKVHDIHAAITAAQEAGIKPILLRLDHPQWKEAFLHPRDTGLGFLAQMVQAPQSVEDITGETIGGPPCPWQENGPEPLRVPLIHGTVANLQQARRVLCGVLGAGETPVGDNLEAAAFHWAEGAWLVLTQTADGQAGPPPPHGIDTILAVPADGPWHPRGQLALLPELLAAGTAHPEIGLRIATVGAPPGPPGP